MDRLSVLLPAAKRISVWATPGRAADETRAASDPRSRQQVMADMFHEHITGLSAADAVPVTVNLVMSDETLLCGGRAPG
jgi:hypothetical protein